MKTNIIYLTNLFLLLMLVSCNPTTNNLPDTALCTKDATTMEENFITLKDIKVDDELDNRVISFTHEQMKSNLDYLTAEARKLNISEKQLGFRVYFAAKKDEAFTKGNLKSINPGEVAYSTVFFVATVKGDSDDANDYENVYDIPALNYGSSRRPPNAYKSNMKCPIHPTVIH